MQDASRRILIVTLLLLEHFILLEMCIFEQGTLILILLLIYDLPHCFKGSRAVASIRDGKRVCDLLNEEVSTLRIS